jgi:sporulation protein YlmC with PRC-barrel domain
MSSRILMATVAAIALAVPAAAQDQAKPLETEQDATQQLERTQPLQEQGGGSPEAAAPTGQAAEPTEAEQPPVTAEDQPGMEPAEDLAQEEEAAPPAEMAFIEVQDEAQFLAHEEVIGKHVVNVMDEQVGTVADLVMDQEQKLVGVVLSVGGFLGIGDKWVAIPVDQIDFPTDEQPARLLVAVTEEQLKNAPDFMTREAVEAEEEAAQAEQQALQQQQQVPPPATTTQ